MTAGPGGAGAEAPRPIGEYDRQKSPKQEERENLRALKRAAQDRERNTKQLNRILAGKPALTVLERIAQAVDVKRAVRSLSENIASATAFLRETKQPVYEEGENMYDGPLSKKLERFVDAEKLAENARAYPELARDLKPEEQRQVLLIRDTLLNVPLVHATPRHIQVPYEPLLPQREIGSDGNNNTTPFDRDLGLNEYVFMHWGFPRVSGYGGNILLIDSHVLLDDHTIVTPSDIFNYVISMDKRFSQLPKAKRKGIQEGYFNRVISGERWLELTARRILAEYQQAKTERRPYLFVQGENSYMGEVKFHGIIPPKKIRGNLSRGDESLSDHYRFLYQHGFAYGHMEDGREQKAQTGHTNHETPEDLGIDHMQATQFWANLLEPKQNTGNQ